MRKRQTATVKSTAKSVRVVLCAPPDFVAETAPVWATLTDLGSGTLDVKLRYSYPGITPAAGWRLQLDHETLTVVSVTDGTMTCQA